MKKKINNIEELKKKANDVRKNIIKMMYNSGLGHIGGSLSCADILTVLYFNELDICPENPRFKNRDRFILSKGHSAAALYSVLAERGFFNKEILFNSFIKCDGILQEHTDRNKIPGVDVSTGSLGQGLSVGVGMALGSKLKKLSFRIYVVIGCGEMQEGQIWEAAMAASHYHLGNLCVFVDYNKLQVCGFNNEIMSIEPVSKKWEAFNWNVIEIDGHSIDEILKSLNKAKQVKKKPTMIIARTIKGKGISFMENDYTWHSAKITEEIYKKAIKELELYKN
ncbi:MAG: transketolase [Actinobacteria bacterium]|nr:transketolase [Actinomycetota bacterium]